MSEAPRACTTEWRDVLWRRVAGQRTHGAVEQRRVMIASCLAVVPEAGSMVAAHDIDDTTILVSTPEGRGKGDSAPHPRPSIAWQANLTSFITPLRARGGCGCRQCRDSRWRLAHSRAGEPGRQR